VAGLLCHAATYRAWPRDVQQAVREAAQEAGAAQRALAAAEDGEVLRGAGADGVEVTRLTETERAAFADAVAPAIDGLRERLGAWLFDYLA
jgi:TRAP-type C4-dicarboxylate transport system substrate-binding protein